VKCAHIHRMSTGPETQRNIAPPTLVERNVCFASDPSPLLGTCTFRVLSRHSERIRCTLTAGGDVINSAATPEFDIRPIDSDANRLPWSHKTSATFPICKFGSVCPCLDACSSFSCGNSALFVCTCTCLCSFVRACMHLQAHNLVSQML
jgi:hypothetical protein